MVQRIKALAAKKWYITDNPTATGYTVSEIRTTGPQQLAKRIGSYTDAIPGTKASKAKLRSLILAIVAKSKSKLGQRAVAARAVPHRRWATYLASSARLPRSGITGKTSFVSSRRLRVSKGRSTSISVRDCGVRASVRARGAARALIRRAYTSLGSEM